MEETDQNNEWDLDNATWQRKPGTEPKEPQKHKRGRRSECYEREHTNVYRRAFSETQLLDILGVEFKENHSYHCITAGDVDSLSYLKCVIRQQTLDYCLLSTWCMALDDVLQLKEWLETGKIKKLDCYVGEIFSGSYPFEYAALKRIITPDIGRIALFRNHSKIYAGYGDKFYFGIETSANINTNPRTENGCITIDKGLFEFYKQYFDGINSFEKELK